MIFDVLLVHFQMPLNTLKYYPIIQQFTNNHINISVVLPECKDLCIYLCCKNIIRMLQFLHVCLHDFSVKAWKSPQTPENIFIALNWGAEKGFKSSKPATKGTVSALCMILIQILL